MTTSIEPHHTQQFSEPNRLSSRGAQVRRVNQKRLQVMLKPIAFVALSLPFCWVVYAALTNQLGSNPVEAITDFTGEWSLRILLLSLCMTPLRMALRKPWPIQLRRMVGLFAFFYVSLHLCTYIVLDQQFDMAAIFDDLLKRTYIMAGALAFVCLVPLAITSTNAMMKRLGKRWLLLHRIVYVAAVAAVVHFIWLSRGDQLEPWIYAFVLLVLMLFRVKKLLPKRRKAMA